MTNLLHKKILIKDKQTPYQSTSFYFYGKLMGWTDGEKVVDCDGIQKIIKEQWDQGGEDSIATLMKGIIGPCIVEITHDDDVWFFTSCASSGLYWMKLPEKDKGLLSYLISNDEGKFLRQANRIEGKIDDAALMNFILSHQSVARPPFDGLVPRTKRLPPGFYIKYSTDKVKINCYLLNNQRSTRRRQDLMLTKKMKAINDVYGSYCRIQEKKAMLAFSGGVDSTALLLNHKSILDKSSQGYYIDRGKLAEKKMAHEIINRIECQIDFVKPIENFSSLKIRQKAEKGLSMLNGLTYIKHGFNYFPYDLDQKDEMLILTGQNSDTLFHVDTFAPSSFTTGIIRLIKMTSSLYLRFKTTIAYFRLCRILKKNFLSNITKTYSSLSEHKTNNNTLPSEIIKIIKNYKNKYYVLPFTNWYQGEFNYSLNKTILTEAEKNNHATRLARWIRTMGNFHQLFFNISCHERIIICTPFSEGPIASELLSYHLNIKDIFFPKTFLHKYISGKIGISYGKLRKKVFNDRLIYFPGQIIYYGIKFINLKFKRLIKFRYNKSIKVPPSHRNINQEHLDKLREIIGHKKGIVDRVLIDYVSDSSCKKYLNYLYDCIELKIEPNTLSDLEGSALCRLVNLQIMLIAEEKSKI